MKMFKSVLLACALLSLFATSAFAQGLPDKYHTYAEAVSELQALAVANPSICFLDSIGYSNRDSLTIYAFKISDNVADEEDEPAILLCGGVHADEILGPEIIIAFCNDIVFKYAQGDTAAVSYVNSFEIYAVPFINPEGHTVVENGDMDWRKNKTDNNSDSLFDFPDGVDNNRNYDFGWSLDNSPGGLTPESLMYKGPYPFSESENRAMRDFGLKYKPLVAVDYHSPTYGPSQIVYYCWYWGQLGRFSPDASTMQEIGSHFAGAILKDDDVHTYSLGAGSVDKGDFKTYFYGNFGTAAFTLEVSDTTIQDTSLVDSICQHNIAGIYYLLHRSEYARLTGVVTDSLTGLPLEAEVKVLEATGPEINPRLTRVHSGRYDRLIKPDTVTIEVSKAGYVTKTVAGVIVTNDSLTITDFQLIPRLYAPLLLSPPDSAFYQDSTALTFNWTSSFTADGYIIEIASDSVFLNIFERDSVSTSTQYRNFREFNEGRYFWRVMAYNYYAPPSPCQRAWSFFINRAPSAPIAILPPNGSSTNALSEICWLAPGDLGVLDSLYYSVQIDDDSLFVSCEIECTELGMGHWYPDTICIPIGQLDGFPNLVADTRYFWRIRAHDIYGQLSPWNDGLRFFVFMAQNHPPLPPDSAFSPSGGAEIVTLTPLISWDHAIDPNYDDSSNTLSYILEIGIDTLSWEPAIGDTSAPGQNFIISDSLIDNTHYFYRIKTFDNGGLSSNWSLVQDFRTNCVNSPPEPFPLYAPDNGARQILAFTHFAWGMTSDLDPLSSLTFNLQFAIDSSFSNPIGIIDVSIDTVLTILTDSLGMRGQYLFWRVVAIDEDSLIRIGGMPEQARQLVILFPGDANGSGACNGVDVLFLVGYLKGSGPAPNPLLAGDANGSCQTNGLDVTYLVAYLKGQGGAPVRGVCETSLKQRLSDNIILESPSGR